MSALTVAQLAAHKKLPLDFLRKQGVVDGPRGVVIPYYTAPGMPEARSRLRKALVAKEGSEWLPGVGAIEAYGSWRLPSHPEHRELHIVEGETDSWVLWSHGIPALGIPGANMTQVLRGEHLLRVKRILIHHERDAAGGQFVSGVIARLKELKWDGEARVLRLPEGIKDAADLHAVNEERFVEVLTAACTAARTTAEWVPDGAGAPVDILDGPPAVLDRPARIINGAGHMATWVWPSGQSACVLVVLRDDGRLYTDAPVRGALPLRELGCEARLPHVPAGSILSGAGVKRAVAGDRPSPAQAFRRVVEVVNQCVSFTRSLSDQRVMCELVASFVMSTYLLDAFDVIGYLWLNGLRGSGKTRLLQVISQLAYLGTAVQSSGTFAALRDLAGYGGCIGFDEAETLNSNHADPNKRALALAGNRRGTQVPFKRNITKSQWVTEHVDAYCPRVFAAIRRPDDVLASRCIVVPLVRDLSDHIDPTDHDSWPTPRRDLLDDLWLIALRSMATVKRLDRTLPAQVSLRGRDLEPWRAILTVAMWLQTEHGVDGVFDRLATLAAAYQGEREHLEVDVSIRLLLTALDEILGTEPAAVVQPAHVAARVNALATAQGLADNEAFTSAHKVGRMLSQLRFPVSPRTARGRLWKISRLDLDEIARSQGVSFEPHVTGQDEDSQGEDWQALAEIRPA